MQGGNDMAEGMMSTEIIMVPNKMVGLIIGRGGEQITRYIFNDHLRKLSASSFNQKRHLILHGCHFVITIWNSINKISPFLFNRLIIVQMWSTFFNVYFISDFRQILAARFRWHRTAQACPIGNVLWRDHQLPSRKFLEKFISFAIVNISISIYSLIPNTCTTILFEYL